MRNYGHNSVTHTDFQSKPWWQVDLDKEETIRQINIYNRTDAAQDRLTNFNVILLDSSGKKLKESALHTCEIVPLRFQLIIRKLVLYASS